MEAFLIAFVSAFVVMNALPVIPVLLDQTDDLRPGARRALFLEAWGTGGVVAALVVVAGPPVLAALGVTLGDMRVAGGVVLLVFAVHDLLFSRASRKERTADQYTEDAPDNGHMAGSRIVPLGIPILIGPGTLATLAVLSEEYGAGITVAALGANLAINLVMLLPAPLVWGRLPVGVTGAMGKVMSLLLAALAASMLRAGITEALAG